jgi:hypothetical protein
MKNVSAVNDGKDIVTKEYVDNGLSSIGSINLLRNADFNGLTSWSTYQSTTTVSGGVATVTPTVSGTRGSFLQSYTVSDSYLVDGKTYTLGVWLKAAENTNSARCAIGWENKDIAVTTEWQYFEVSFNNVTGTTGNFHNISFSVSDTVLYVKEPKLVEGNYITSGYAPSPLDNCKVDKLFDGTLTTSNANLTHPITNYDYIIASFCLGTGATVYNGTIMDSSANIAANYGNTYMADYSSSAARGEIIFVDANTVKHGKASQPTRILGIKCSLS